MKLVNISNYGRTLYLYCRDEKGNQIIDKVTDFYPYFYEVDEENGSYKSFDGKRLRKVMCVNPWDIKEQRTDESYEADINFSKKFLLDKIDNLEKCPIKWTMIDIEIKCSDFPNPQQALYPISCITLYNSFKDKDETWYLPDYPDEEEMLLDFIDYLKREKFDLILGFNVINFDYTYLQNRLLNQFDIEFAKEISPIGKTRKYKDLILPAGTSLVDYRLLYKTVQKGLPNYDLDSVFEFELGKGKQHPIEDFNIINEELKQHNIEDIKSLVKVEKKRKLIDYYDEIRRISKVEWEDFGNPMRVIDMLLLQEAKKQQIILPSKQKDREKVKFEGAFRRAFELGLFFGIDKADLTSAYPSVIDNYCLDSSNIVDKEFAEEKDVIKVDIKDRETQEITKSYYVRQNPNALLPSVVRQILENKNKLKAELKEINPETIEYELKNSTYSAYKALCNAAYGIFGNPYFRLYDSRVAEMTTAIVRDLLHYVKEKIEMTGKKLLYVDTDSCMYDGGGKSIIKDLNAYIQEWSNDRFGKDSIIKFEYEGRFLSLFIINMCRYIGKLETDKGIKEEMCGIEARRANSTIFMKGFQKELLIKFLNKTSKHHILEWIKEQISLIKNSPILSVAFPCKLARKACDYVKKDEIFVRALRNTQRNIKYEKRIGERYWWIPVKPELDKDGKLVKGIKGKSIDVLAFDKKINEHIDKDKVDWDAIIEKNITKKIKTIFEAMKWEEEFKELFPKKIRIRKSKRIKAKITKKHPKIATETAQGKDIIINKPNDGTYANNALKHGVSGLNIDGGRIGTDGTRNNGRKKDSDIYGGFGSTEKINYNKGRFPANIILDEEAGKMLDEQSGISKSNASGYNFEKGNQDNPSRNVTNIKSGVHFSDKGGASRFFYIAKASKAERNEGCKGLEIKQTIGGGGTNNTEDDACGKYDSIKSAGYNFHPTVKPIKLMEYLCILTKTPTGGIILDPFLGSGTTAVAAINTDRKFIGFDLSKEYIEIAKARIKNAKEKRT